MAGGRGAGRAVLQYAEERGPGTQGLESAIANAETNENADIDELKVAEIYVNKGVTMKRIKPRAKGRADRIFKRSCHVTVTVTDE